MPDAAECGLSRALAPLTNPATRSATLDTLLNNLQHLRDDDPTADDFRCLFALPEIAYETYSIDAQCKLHSLIVGVLRLPEFAEAAPLAAPHFTIDWLRFIFERISRPADGAEPSPPTQPQSKSAKRSASSSASAPVSSSQLHTLGGVTQVSRGKAGAADLPINKNKDQPVTTPGSAHTLELTALKEMLHFAYRGGGRDVRAEIRASIGPTLLTLAHTNPPPPGISSLLDLLACIIKGFKRPTPSHTALMKDILGPLHKPISRIDEITPVLSLYHEPLCHCLVSLITLQPPLLLACIPSILTAWPEMREVSSKQEHCHHITAP